MKLLDRCRKLLPTWRKEIYKNLLEQKKYTKKFVANAAEEKNDHNYFVCSGRTF